MNKKLHWIFITLIAIAVVAAPAAACCCRITGIGQIRGDEGAIKASFGGNGQSFKDGNSGPYVDGEWNHVDHVGKVHFKGDVDYLNCFFDPTFAGPDVPKADFNWVQFGSEDSGKLTLADGTVVKRCSWQVTAYDINEGGIHRDGYLIGVECPDGPTLYNQATTDACLSGPVKDPIGTAPIGCLHGGNFQIHPTNRGHPCLD